MSFEESAKLDKKGRISFYARHIHDLVVTAKSKSAASVASSEASSRRASKASVSSMSQTASPTKSTVSGSFFSETPSPAATVSRMEQMLKTENYVDLKGGGERCSKGL